MIGNSSHSVFDSGTVTLVIDWHSPNSTSLYPLSRKVGIRLSNSVCIQWDLLPTSLNHNIRWNHRRNLQDPKVMHPDLGGIKVLHPRVQQCRILNRTTNLKSNTHRSHLQSERHIIRDLHIVKTNSGRKGKLLLVASPESLPLNFIKETTTMMAKRVAAVMTS